MTQAFAQLGDAISQDLPAILFAALMAGIGVFAALVLHAIIFAGLKRMVKASQSKSDNLVVSMLQRPMKWALVLLGLLLAARQTPLLAQVWDALAGFAVPALIGWIVLAIMRSLVKAMELRLDLDSADNLNARRRQTRLTIFSRIGTFLIIFATVGMMLLAIPGVRDVGVTLMASAGLAALAVGAAAQPALKALIAGVQMALTEPVRIDDVVIVDGEWGRIEDIRTTYVVVRIWDERRLIVPSSKFLEESFQNWTRKSAEMLGTVFLHLDPMADIAPLRAEFLRQVEANGLWDGRVKAAQVTDTTLDALELRLLMSAKDASDLFDLRCQIRESMLAFIRQHMPEAIAMRRVTSATEVTWEAGEPGQTPGKD